MEEHRDRIVTADLLLGMSFGWWVEKHNRHHANPNHVERDPDINNPAIAYTEEQALGRWGPLRLLARYQAVLFFPLLACSRGACTSLESRSWSPSDPAPAGEGLALLAHLALYVGLLVYALGPWTALLVIVIHKAIGGFYLASVFAPNHKGMPQTDDDSELDFLRAQVITSEHPRRLVDRPAVRLAQLQVGTTCSHGCRATGCGGPARSSRRSAPRSASPTTRRRSSAPTASCCGSCTRSALRCGPGRRRRRLTSLPTTAEAVAASVAVGRRVGCRWAIPRPSQPPAEATPPHGAARGPPRDLVDPVATRLRGVTASARR